MATTLAKLAIVMLADTRGLRAGFNQAKGEVRGFNANVGGSVTALGSLAGAAKFTAITAGITAATLAMKKFATVGIEAAATIEQLQIAFEVMTGSAQTATDLIGDLRKFSAETPLDLQGTQQAAKTLLAMGEPVEALIDDLTMLGDVAAGTGQPINELAQLFGQVMQAGRLTGNELRQFNERGIPLMIELSEQMGVSKAAIREMVEEGRIGSADVVRAFESMTSAGGQFANMMERQTQTLTGQWNKFKENMTIVAAGAMSPVAEGLERILFSFNDVLDQMTASAKSAEFKTASKEAAAAMREQEEAAKRAEEAAKKAADEQKKALEQAKSTAEGIAESLRTPEEVFKDTLTELHDLTSQGLLSWELYERGIKRAADQLDKATKSAMEFKSAGRITVGAAAQGTSAGHSALVQAQVAAQQQVALAREAAARHDRTNRLIGEVREAVESKEPIVIQKLDAGM